MKTKPEWRTSCRPALALAAALLAAAPAAAQEAGEEAPDAGAPAGDGRLDALELENAALRERLDRVEQRLDDVETAAFDEAAGSEELERLTVSGFFDVSFARFFTDEDSMFDGILPEHGSFFLQNLNLYFNSQLTDTVSSLIELHFTPLPMGQEEAYEIAGMGVDYERTDTTVATPFTDEKVALGGVGIERAYLKWQPRDWFGVVVGRYLTPYGIWNVDHGTPLLLTVRYPYVQILQIVPSHQLGLQALGRFIPRNGFFIDYAITLSNGRGPTESAWDLDENKGAGLRLRFAYEGDDVKVAVGGYGYVGDVTDIKKTMVVTPSFDVDIETTEEYREYATSVDIRIEAFGVLFQTEWARGLNLYSVRPLRTSSRGPGYQPDYVASSCYGLLGYTLPVARFIGGVLITPYVMYEYAENDDTAVERIGRGQVIAGGLNVKVLPEVAIKAEYGHKFTTEIGHSNFDMVAAQIAVAF